MSLNSAKTSRVFSKLQRKGKRTTSKRMHKITQYGPDYFQCLPIQPGSNFFRALAESKYPISSIMLNIPAILINFGVPVLLSTSISLD